MSRWRQEIKIEKKNSQTKKKKTRKTPLKYEEKNKSMADHQKHLSAERWTSIWEEQVYIPPEERQQPKSWEQTNEEEKKTTKKSN